MSTAPVRSALGPWWPVGLVIVLWGLLYHASIGGMAAIWWRSETFAHGMVVAPISLWLVWRSRVRLGGLSPAPTLAALPALAFFALVWLAGVLVSLAGVEHLGVVGLLVAGLWAALGNRLAKVLAFPLAFLFFAVPEGEFLVPTLMHYTAEFTVWALRASGIPVYQEGLQFVLPNGRWSVVEACSGIRYLIASLMVGTLYAYLTYCSLKKRLVFIAFAAVLPILANWLRAYLIVMVGYLSDGKLAAGVDHLIYGWVFFGVVIFAMFWIGSFWRDPEPDPASIRLPLVASPATARPQLAALALVLLFVGLPAPIAASIEPADREVSARIDLPAAAEGWQREPAPGAAFEPGLTGYRAQARSAYSVPQGTVELWAMLYANQTAAHELVGWANQLRPAENEAKRWSLLEQGARELTTGRVGYSRLRGPAGDFEAFDWYWIDGRTTSSDLRAKLLLAWQAIRGRGDAAARVVIVIPASEGRSGIALVERFVTEHREHIEQALRDAASSVR